MYEDRCATAWKRLLYPGIVDLMMTPISRIKFDVTITFLSNCIARTKVDAEVLIEEELPQDNTHYEVKLTNDNTEECLPSQIESLLKDLHNKIDMLVNQVRIIDTRMEVYQINNDKLGEELSSTKARIDTVLRRQEWLHKTINDLRQSRDGVIMNVLMYSYRTITYYSHRVLHCNNYTISSRSRASYYM